MKRIVTILLFITALLFGHGGHNHKSKSAIQQIAKKKIAELIQSKKINKSWKRPYVLDTKKKYFGKLQEWIVSFENSDIKDPKKKIIYVFVSEEGKVQGANYTGK